MATYTKSTVLTWQAYNDFVPTEVRAMMDQINEMGAILEQEGKTDNLPDTVRTDTTTVVTRKWIDLAAAQEWVSFVNTTTNNFGFPNPPHEIKDL